MTELEPHLQGVQHDGDAGIFAKISVEDGEVVLYDVFTGDPYHRFDSVEEFKEEAEDDFFSVPDEVVNNPVRVIENVLDAVQDGRTSKYDSFDLMFARRAVSIDVNDYPDIDG